MALSAVPDAALPDEALVAGLATGDTQLEVAFVRRFQQFVYGIAFTVLRDGRLAEDAAQAAFVKAWRGADSFDARRGTVRGWLGTIAHRCAIDIVRTRRPDPVDPADLAALIPQPSRASGAEDAIDLRRALATLPADQARAVVLAAMYGLTSQEVADAEHIPIGTAKGRIRLALGKLKRALDNEEVCDD